MVNKYINRYIKCCDYTTFNTVKNKWIEKGGIDDSINCSYCDCIFSYMNKKDNTLILCEGCIVAEINATFFIDALNTTYMTDKEIDRLIKTATEKKKQGTKKLDWEKIFKEKNGK